MILRLWCGFRGHVLVFVRNIHGDEINVSRGRSIYRCVECGYTCYGLKLRLEKTSDLVRKQ